MAKFNNPNDGKNGGEVDRPRRHMIVEPRCRVCKSQWRKIIDQGLVWGVADSELARQFEDQGLTRQSIRNHRLRHLNVEMAALRKIIDEDEATRGEQVKRTKDQILSQRTMLDVAIRKGFHDLVSVDGSVDAHSWGQLINLRAKLMKDEEAAQLEQLHREMTLFQQSVQEEVPMEYFSRVLDAFNAKMAREQKMVDSYGVELGPSDFDGIDMKGISDGS